MEWGNVGKTTTANKQASNQTNKKTLENMEKECKCRISVPVGNTFAFIQLFIHVAEIID